VKAIPVKRHRLSGHEIVSIVRFIDFTAYVRDLSQVSAACNAAVRALYPNANKDCILKVGAMLFK
jgi:hypothetical protein